MARASSSEQKVHDLSTRRWNHAREYWRPHNDLYGRLLAFCLDLEHYTREEGFTRDKRRIQPKTQRQFNLIRHKMSLLLRNLPNFDTHAVQPGADQAKAEVSRRVIENVFLDPLKGYHEVRSRFVLSALAGGRGDIAIEWHPKWGVCFRFVDPRRIHIAPGFTFMHDPRNPFVIEEVPMRLSEVHRMKASGWSVPADLTPDNWKPENIENRDNGRDGIDMQGSNNRNGIDDADPDDGIVTVLKVHYRDDPMTRKPKSTELPMEEWFWVDDTTQEQIAFDQENPAPPQTASGSMPRLVQSKDQMNGYAEGDDGYLCIVAPHYSGKKPLFEGKWLEGAINPQASLPAFPYMEMVGYRHPLRRTGSSDTELTHSLAVIDDASFRATWEQMRQSGGVLVTMAGALLDSEGNQFQFSSDPISIAYAKDRLALESTNFFQSSGMNAAMPAFRQMVDAQWAYIGTGDTAMPSDRSRDIAVGTVNMLQQQGDLPVQLHQQDLNLQESIGAAVALGYCRAYMGDQVVSWVTDEGDAGYATVRGSDLVPLNVSASAGKEWRQQDIDRVQATAQFFGMVSKLGLPLQAIAVMAREAGISDNITKAITQAMSTAQTAPEPGSMPPPQGGPPAPDVGGGQ